MEKYPTVLLAAEALNKENFSFFNIANVVKIGTEFSDFCNVAFREYKVMSSPDGFKNCLAAENAFFTALVVIAEKMPLQLRNEDLKEFIGFMYQKPGAYFKGMLKVLDACQMSEHYRSSFAGLHVAHPEVREWIKSHWDFCCVYRDEIVEAMAKENIFDPALSILCKPYRFFAPMYLTYFMAGLFIGFLVLLFFLISK